MHIGILGGGQLGRMLALAGVPLGLRFRFLDPSPYAPAHHVGELVVGDYLDPAALDQFAKGLDLVTFEFENVPVEAVRHLSNILPVVPGPKALEIGQDRLNEKSTFRQLGFQVHDFQATRSREELHAAIEKIGLPCIAKIRSMGYDGKGQWVMRNRMDVERAAAEIREIPVLVETLIPFTRELSIIACRARPAGAGDRSGSGHAECRFWPLVQNIHDGGILRKSIAPAPNIPRGLQHRAEAHAHALLEHLDYIGVLAIEFFVVEDATGTHLLANEFAPRVHNSGHWTIEGSCTSQFENHCRAIAGLPLGDCSMRASPDSSPSTMLNLIGEAPATRDLLSIPHAHVHLYDKDPKPGRKIGHVTVHGGTPEENVGSIERIEALIRTVVVK